MFLVLSHACVGLRTLLSSFHSAYLSTREAGGKELAGAVLALHAWSFGPWSMRLRAAAYLFSMDCSAWFLVSSPRQTKHAALLCKGRVHPAEGLRGFMI